jgi:hypothetical protein
MKKIWFIAGPLVCSLLITGLYAQKKNSSSPKNQLYIDVHHLGPGKVSSEAVATAHQKDLAEEKKYGVRFIKYWVDTARGVVYCLSTARNPQAITATHALAHGLLPDETYQVSDGRAAGKKGNAPYFLDVHELGAGNVTARAVAEAHKKDLAVEKKYGVHFINYWVDEKAGKVFCLSQAADSSLVISTHKEAHGLLPAYILSVRQGE